MINFEKVRREYLAKWEELEKKTPDFENLSLIEIYSKINLTDDEIWMISASEIASEDRNMVWEGFPALSEDEKIELSNKRFDHLKLSIEKAAIESKS